MTTKAYDKSYFQKITLGSLESAKHTIPIILAYFTPITVLDVGCGVGAWLSEWKEAGVKEIRGIDGEYINIEDLLIDPKEFTVSNLEKGFEAHTKFDLVTCLEVAEHIQPENVENLIDSICQSGDVILFSAAIPNQEGTLHVNEQYPEYWIKLFEKKGYSHYDVLRHKLWNNNKIAWWYRQNMLFFINNKTKNNYPKILLEKNVISSIVHPELLRYKQSKIDKYEHVLKNPLYTTKYFILKYLKSLSRLLKK